MHEMETYEFTLLIVIYIYIYIYIKKRLGYIILNQSTKIYRKDGNRIGGGQMSLERLMLVKLDFNLPPRSL
jgi:hypothetical protein